MATSEVLPDGSSRFVGASGVELFTRLKPGHVLLTVSGRYDEEIGALNIDGFEREIAAVGFCIIFTDARLATGSSVAGRELIGDWLKRHEREVPSSHVLFRSRLVEMSVALINLVTGGTVRTYSNVPAFEREIRNLVPSFRALPVVAPESPKHPTVR